MTKIKILALSSPLNKNQTLPQIPASFKYEIKIAPDIFDPALFCANNDIYRANSLIDALLDEEVDNIWLLKGGYGISRIIPILEKSTALNNSDLRKKTIIGFSDVTALHIFLNQRFGMKTIHGLNYIQFVDIGTKIDKKNFEIIDSIFSNRVSNIEITQIQPLNITAAKSHNIKGEVIGGNLSIIQTSIGTNWSINPVNKILILEDVNEDGYRIDRMLEHIFQNDILKSVKALIFGNFHNCGSDYEEALIRISDILEGYSIPVFKTDMIGHGYHNHPFIYGEVGTIMKCNNELYKLQQNWSI